MGPTYPLVPIANFIALTITVVPLLIGVVKPRNIGAFMFAIWISVEAFLLGVNAIIWSDSVDDFAPAWCDISTRISIACNVGIPACSLVITRQLFNIISLKDAVNNQLSRRKEIVFGLFMCLALPLLTILLYYIVQGARYIIFEEYGCASAVAGIGMSDLLLDSWQILMPAISVFLYTPRIVWRLYCQRKELDEFLDSNASYVSRSHYYRILALGSFDAVVTLPLNVLAMVTNAAQARTFWPGWVVVHENMAVVAQVPKCAWADDFWANFALQESRWINVILGALFFALFGVVPEARAKYWRIVWGGLRILGVKSSPQVKEERQASAIVFEYCRGARSACSM